MVSGFCAPYCLNKLSYGFKAAPSNKTKSPRFDSEALRFISICVCPEGYELFVFFLQAKYAGLICVLPLFICKMQNTTLSMQEKNSSDQTLVRVLPLVCASVEQERS